MRTSISSGQWPAPTRTVKILLFTLAGIALIHPIFSGTLGIRSWVFSYLYLSNHGVFDRGYVWQLVTHMFLHEDFFHLVFNCFALYVFGNAVEERTRDTKTFLLFLFVCGLGAALASVLWNLAFPGVVGASGWSLQRSTGASGAISGLIGAYCLYHWNTPLRFFFGPSIPGKALLVFIILIDILQGIFVKTISVEAHFGGLLTGLVLTEVYAKPLKLIARYKLWRIKRKLKVLAPPVRDPDEKPPTYH